MITYYNKYKYSQYYNKRCILLPNQLQIFNQIVHAYRTFQVTLDNKFLPMAKGMNIKRSFMFLI
jgi:hypothetical protein